MLEPLIAKQAIYIIPGPLPDQPLPVMSKTCPLPVFLISEEKEGEDKWPLVPRMRLYSTALLSWCCCDEEKRGNGRRATIY